MATLESLILKQTCRSFAYHYDLHRKIDDDDDDEEDDGCEFLVKSSNIYDLQFLRASYENPACSINKIIHTFLMCNDTVKDSLVLYDNDTEIDYNIYERVIVLDYFKKLTEMKSLTAKCWTELQHYLCFVYRHCMRCDPTPEQENLSTYFVNEMRSLSSCLIKNDQIQLCLRIFSLVREYTVFACKQYQKIKCFEKSIEYLFFYYEAFLSATKNICKIFPDLEKLLLNSYKLGWLDFNTSIFMFYFYETDYVQSIMSEFELKRNSVSTKATRIYTIITELHKLWKSQICGIRNIMMNKDSGRSRALDTIMIASHKHIIGTNFWIDRTSEEKSLLDLKAFHYQLFMLVGDKSLALPSQTLDELGQCICENCLIIKYKSFIENNQNKIRSGSTKFVCRYCQQKFDNFQEHIKNYEQFDKLQDNSDNDKRNLKAETVLKIGNDQLILKNELLDNEVAATKLELQEFIRNDKCDDNGKCDDVCSKTIRNFFKLHFNKNTKECFENTKVFEKTTTTSSKVPNLNLKPPFVMETANNPESSAKDSNIKRTFPCSHTCKGEEEVKTEPKKGFDPCDHRKEPSKKCDCTFCEVFGTTANGHKQNETRNRLRIRLSQRNGKGSNKTTTTNDDTNKTNLNGSVNSTTSKAQPSALETGRNAAHRITNTIVTPMIDASSRKSSINDIHGILNYIEGTDNVHKMQLAEKKAAKKARQRMKKELERQEMEEKEKQRIEEEKRALEEKLRAEELAKQLAEKVKISQDTKKSNKKKKPKNNNNSPELMEETIPAMVTIKRVVENQNVSPTVTITLKGSTPDQDKLLYKLVNGHNNNNHDEDDDDTANNKSNHLFDLKKSKNKNFTDINLQINGNNTNNKKKKNNPFCVTLAVDNIEMKKSDKNSNNKSNKTKKNEINMNGDKMKNRDVDINIPMLKLPPGITITKVDGPVTDRNYKTCNNTNNSNSQSYNSNIPVSKSGVIVVDTEKLIKQSNATTSVVNNTTAKSNINHNTNNNKKSKKKKGKKQNEQINNISNGINVQNMTKTNNSKSSMVTLKNPIFHNLQQNRNKKPENDMLSELNSGQCQQAAIFKNENGMVTIRSSRLQQSLTNGTHLPNLLPDLKPVLGPDISSSYIQSSSTSSSANYSENNRISSFNAQEILSGLPGIEITKVDKHSVKNDLDKRSCHTAEVSIIPTNNNGDKFNFDKDDWYYDSVFTPKDILDDMDAEERELEAFKRFCQQSVPPKQKEKVAHLNVKDIVFKKKNLNISA